MVIQELSVSKWCLYDRAESLKVYNIQNELVCIRPALFFATRCDYPLDWASQLYICHMRMQHQSRLNQVLITALCFSLVMSFSACSKSTQNIEGCWQHSKFKDRIVKVGSDSMYTYIENRMPIAFKIWYSNVDCKKEGEVEEEATYMHVEYRDDDSTVREECYELMDIEAESFKLRDGHDTISFTSYPCEDVEKRFN